MKVINLHIFEYNLTVMGRSSFYAKKAAGVLSGNYKIKREARNFPRMHEMDSTYIKSIGYDRRQQRLFIAFRSNREKIGYYDQVPENIFKDMLNAESPGVFQRTVLGPEYTWFYLDKNEPN